VAQTSVTYFDFTTFAGQPVPPGSAAATGPSAAADGTTGIVRFATPNGLAIDTAGNFYVADTTSHLIRKVSANGTVVSTLAGINGSPGSRDGPAAQAQFNAPLGVAVDAAGNVYVADTGNHTVRKITPGGVVATFAGMAGMAGSADGPGVVARFDQPGAIAVDASGNVDVADTGNDTVRQITPAGMVSTLAGLAGQSGSGDGPGSAARFSGPAGIAVNGAGTVYVADSGNGSIRSVTAAGLVATLATGLGPLTALAVDGRGNVCAVTTLFSPIFGGHDQSVSQVTPAGAVSALGALEVVDQESFLPMDPGGIVVDAAGNIYVTDPDSGMIRERTAAAGTVAIFVGTDEEIGAANFLIADAGLSLDGTVGTARFNGPAGVAVDAAADVFIADTGNDTIRRISPGGLVTTLAGTAGQAGSADGPGNSASFNAPAGLAIDTAGNLFVADTGNQAIRKISPAGAVSTLAAIGVPVTSLAVDGAGNIYAANTAQDTVLKISSAGSVAILAGTPGSPGHADGPAAGALFNAPTVVAVDGAGNVFVYDSGGYSVRRITPAGVVSTLAGGSTPQSAGFGPPGDPADGLGSAAQFGDVLGMIADAAGDLFVTVFNEVREINPSGQVTNGAPISGANYSDLEINGISTLQGGSYSVVVTNAYGSTASTPAVTQSVGAFPLVPGAGDSALVVTLPPGNYTVEVGDVEVGTTGLALLEIYEIP